MVRYTVRFEGIVQGVGFRAGAAWIARGFPVTGFVRNERDGSVCLVAEGDAEELDAFLAAIRAARGGTVHAMHVDRGVATGEWTGFTVQR